MTRPPLATICILMLALLTSACSGGGSERVSAPPAITFTGPEAVAIGARVVIVADARDRDGGAILSRTWEQLEGPPVQLSGFEDDNIEFNAPRTTETVDVVFEHCVTDDEQDEVCRDFEITILSAVDLGLRGGIQMMLDLTDSQTGLPRDEASLRELQNGRFNSNEWWPQHAAMLMTALVIGHALTEEDLEVFDELNLGDEDFLNHLDRLINSLEIIVRDRSRHFPARDFLAFYHIYEDRLAQTDSLGRFVLFEDNAMLYTALTIAFHYLQPIDEEMAERVLNIRSLMDLSLWTSPDGTISLGTTELPVAEDKIDRFNTQLRISLVAARAAGAISKAELEAILADLLDQSTALYDIPALPPLGKMMETYAPIPWLGERDTALYTKLLEPMYDAHVFYAERLGVPISHTSVPIIQRRTVEYALSPFEGVDALLQEFQDLPVITPPGAAMVTAMGTEGSLVNWEETVLILENELEGGVNARYGTPTVFDWGYTATVPEDISPMYGTLETGYAIAALATNRLDRDFLVNLLRRDLGWDRAIRDYRDILIDLMETQGGSADSPTPVPVDGTVQILKNRFIDDWSIFRQRYVLPEGRVVDTGNNGVSHSEGQGYGMLFAVAAEDRATFEILAQWTSNVLQRDDGLHSWRFNPNTQPPIEDVNSAADGELLIAWSYLRAAELWGDEAYRSEALRIISAFEDRLIRRVAGRLVIIPWDGADLESPRVINPSYFVLPAMRDIADVSSSRLWQDLYWDSLDLLQRSGFGIYQLPPDWLAIDDDNGIGIWLERNPYFSYDAIRVPLHLAWASHDSRTFLAPYLDLWEDLPVPLTPSWVNLLDGQMADSSPVGFHAVRMLTTNIHNAALDAGTDRMPLPSVDLAEDYFSASLILLSRLAEIDWCLAGTGSDCAG
jgi:endoglucanase